MRIVSLLPLLVVSLAHAEGTRELTPAQMQGIRVWDQGRTGVMRGSRPGTLRIAYHAQFKNETPRELASLTVKLLVDAGGRRAFASPTRILKRFANLSVPITGALEPYDKTEYVEGIEFEIPERLWRTDIYDRLVVTGASTFVDPNLHDAGHLYARLGRIKDEEGITLFKKDPSLLKVKNAQGFDTTLMAFVAAGPKCAKYVLAHGGNAKAHTVRNATIMHMAAVNGAPAVLDLALSLGGNVNARTKSGKTPLLKAIVFGQNVRWLLAHGANPRYEESPGHTAAQYAVREGIVEILQEFVRVGVSPRSKDSLGQGWMHYAVYNHLMMEKVHALGVPFDDPNSKTGETPLMEAAWAGWTEPQVWLLQNGADPNRKDKKGKTAFDYAGSYTYDQTMAAYRAHKQTPNLIVRQRMEASRKQARAYFARLVQQYGKVKRADSY